MDIKSQAVWIVTGLGLVSLIGLFARMRGGLHSENLRAVCAVLLFTFAALIAVTNNTFQHLGVLVIGILFGGVVASVISRR